MSVDAKTLYQQQVLAHAKNRRHAGILEPATHRASCINPLCGDRVTIYLNVEHDRVREVRCKVQGCAISKASASMMAELIEGQSLAEARSLSARLKASVAPDGAALPDEDPLQPLSGIRHFPTRTRCGTLPWEALDDALDAQGE